MRRAVAVGLLVFAVVGGSAAVALGHSARQAANFSLNPAKTQVTNTHQGELTIDAAGYSAHFDNSKGGGAHWQADYSWKIPSTLTPGKSATASITDTIRGVQPEQPLRDYMVIRGPDFAKQLIVDHPSPGTGTLNVTFPVSAGYASSKELTITVELVSSSVVYHYVRTTGTGGRATLLIAAHQITNEYGKLNLAVSGKFTSTGKLSDCKASSCHLRLTPVASNYGLQTLEAFKDYDDIRIKFQITGARVDKGPGEKLAVDVQGRVVSLTADGPVPHGLCGTTMGLYAFRGAPGARAERQGVRFGCGAFVYGYSRGFVFKLVGSAITS